MKEIFYFDVSECKNLEWPILLNPELKFKYLNLAIEKGNKFHPCSPDYPSKPHPIYGWMYYNY
jgi:hypothetical protein